jgi:hypothetical protein
MVALKFFSIFFDFFSWFFSRWSIFRRFSRSAVDFGRVSGGRLGGLGRVDAGCRLQDRLAGGLVLDSRN